MKGKEVYKLLQSISTKDQEKFLSNKEHISNQNLILTALGKVAAQFTTFKP